MDKFTHKITLWPFEGQKLYQPQKAPWVCLVVLYLGSHDYFNEGLITCAQHGFVEEMASVLHKSEACQSQCDNYRLADYHFLNSYW